VTGTIQKVDDAGKTIAIKTADGIDETVKLTDRTVVRDAEKAGRATDTMGKVAGTAGKEVERGVGAAALTGKEGTDAFVLYTGEGADKTATLVEHASKGGLKVLDGTVLRMGDDGKTVVVKTASGIEETLQLSEEASVDTGHGIWTVVEAAGRDLKEGDRVTVHYTEAGSRKVAHLFKRL
jgi:DNA-directed RNA polymerase subunit E'/Rpb7